MSDPLKALPVVHNAIESHRLQIIEEAKKELARRMAASEGGNNLTDYIQNPVGFVQDKLDEQPWSKQRLIMGSVMENRRTAVPSCHDSGKSYIASRIAAWWISCHPPGEAFVVTTAPTTAQVRAILWREINKAHKRGRLPGRTNQVEWFLGNELVGFGRKPDDMDLSAFQGIHARYVLVLIDEAGGVVKQLWDAADTLITNESSRIIAIGNPDDPTSHFSEVCKPGSGWKVIPISAFDTPNFTGEDVPDKVREVLVSKLWVEEKRLSWGETSPLWVAKVLGKFPDVGEDTLIGPGLVNDALNREMAVGNPVEIGVDVARYGSDSTVLILRRGNVYKVHKKILKSGLMVVVGEIVRLQRESGATAVKIDDIGLGGGVTDRLKELQGEGSFPASCKIYGVSGSRGATSKKNGEKFINLRAQLYWELREMFVLGEIKIFDDDRLASQASAIKYEVDSKGRIKIESKDDMKARGMPSPDELDALMLASAHTATFEAPDWVTTQVVSPPIAIYQM